MMNGSECKESKFPTSNNGPCSNFAHLEMVQRQTQLSLLLRFFESRNQWLNLSETQLSSVPIVSLISRAIGSRAFPICQRIWNVFFSSSPLFIISIDSPFMSP
jgi:hypothetical protein